MKHPKCWANGKIFLGFRSWVLTSIHDQHCEYIFSIETQRTEECIFFEHLRRVKNRRKSSSAGDYFNQETLEAELSKSVLIVSVVQILMPNFDIFASFFGDMMFESYFKKDYIFILNILYIFIIILYSAEYTWRFRPCNFDWVYTFFLSDFCNTWIF